MNKFSNYILLFVFCFIVIGYTADYVNVGISYNSGSFISYFANTNLLYVSAINDGNISDVYELYDVATSSVIYKGKSSLSVSVSGTKIYIATIGTYSGPLILRPLTNTTTIYVRLSKNASTWKTYRGSIQISVSGSYFKLINTVDIEEYLYGVVPSEIGSWAHAEAQKAQAVAARTFVKKNLTRHSSEGYNVCDTEHCQVYGGKNIESYPARQAVIATKGEVMKYNGSLIYTYYFSCCGGRTANSSDVWGNAYPYLVSIVDDPDEVYDTNDTDDFCYSDTNYYWDYSITHTGLESKLKSSSYTKPTNSSSSLAENGVNIKSYDVSGRVAYFVIQYINPDEQKTVKGTDFRTVLGTSNLKSTMVSTITYNSGTQTYTFSGKGYGHGVGMCQAGADTMGKNGYNYVQILQHYYKGVTIDDVSPPVITHTPVTEVLVNSSITITAYITDSNGVASAKLFYRTAGQQSYYFQNMTLASSNYYSAVIPSNIVNPAGVEYYIEATDNNGNTSYAGTPTQPYYVRVVVTDNSAPVITHTPLSSVVEGTTVTISCVVTDASGVSSVVLYYKNSILTSYVSLQMSKDGDVYSTQILGKDVVIGELRYYIVAKDVYNNTSYYPSVTEQVIVNVTSSDTEGPNITFTPPTEIDYNAPIEFVLQATDPSGIKSVVFYYKNEGETSYKQKNFVNVYDDYYKVELLQQEINVNVSTPTLKYFIIATDNRNNSTVLPQNAPLETYKVIIIVSLGDNNATVVKEQNIITKTLSAKIIYPLKQLSTKTQLQFIITNLKGETVWEVSSWDKVSIVNDNIILTWDGKNKYQQKLPTGVYFYKLKIDNNLVKSGKVIILR